jgi:hypothetical protein
MFFQPHVPRLVKEIGPAFFLQPDDTLVGAPMNRAWLGLVRLAPNPHGLSGIGWV